MLVPALPWQSAQDLSAVPAFFVQSWPPSWTNSMPGLAVGSSCIFCNASPMSR
jgi:hypothetical protein